MNDLITVRSSTSKHWHLLHNSEVTGPHTKPALCGRRPRQWWDEEGTFGVEATCPRCIERGQTQKG